MSAVGLGHTFDLIFVAWLHADRDPDRREVIFNWIATMWGGAIRFTTSMMFATAFLIEFVIGGLSGITFAAAPLDWQTTDTYYVVAHFHYVIFGGSAFGILAALHYWFPKMSGRLLDERLGRLHFWLMVLGFNMTFLVQHWLGLMGMTCARVHVPRPARLGRAQHGVDGGRVFHGPLGARAAREHRQVLAARPAGRRQPVERVYARVGHDLTA